MRSKLLEIIEYPTLRELQVWMLLEFCSTGAFLRITRMVHEYVNNTLNIKNLHCKTLILEIFCKIG